MSGSRLFGDAKATAKEADPARKAKRVMEAKERFELQPSAANQVNYASALFDAGRYQEAEKVLQDLTGDGNSVDPQVLFELGFIYKNLNRKDEAIAAFKRLIEAHPKHSLSRGAENELWSMDPQYKPSWLRK